MTELICIDVVSRNPKEAETGLKYLGRYTVYSRDKTMPCAYCKSLCAKIAVVPDRVDRPGWCQKRFAELGPEMLEDWTSRMDPATVLLPPGRHSVYVSSHG